MASNRNTYIDSDFEKHKNDISKYEDILSSSISKFNDAIESSVKHVASSLGSMEEIAKKFKNSNVLESLVNNYKDLLKQHNSLIDTIGDSTEKLTTKFGLTSKELDEVVKTLSEIDKLNEEIANSNSQSAIIAKNFKEQKLKSDPRYSMILNEYESQYDNETKQGIKDIIEGKEKILELTKDIRDAESEIGEEVDNINDRLDTNKKKLDAIGKVIKSTIGLVSNAGKKWIEIDDIVTKYGRNVGVSVEQTKAYRKNVLDNFGQMSGRLGMTVKEIMVFQEQYAKNTNRATILTNKQIESLAGLSKITSNIATETIVKHMDDFGASVDTASGYLTQAYARAANVGLNAAKTSETFANNIKLASKYTFKDGLNSISKMTLLSQRLKFNMESMSGALDKFSTIEGAISTSANLQLLGGAYANNFSNPLQVMGESLLDPESGYKRIIDAFSSFAYFNKQTGMAEMSPIDKQRMKIAAQELGINYDEAWNIASQSAKAKEVDKSLSKNTKLNDNNREYLRNLAQYDTSSGEFYVTYYDSSGKEKRKSLKDITSNIDVEKIRQNTTKDDILRNDVHLIKDLLAEYVEKTVGETRTSSEILQGIKERYEVGGANLVDYPMRGLKNGASSIANSSTALFGTLGGIYALGRIASPMVSNYGGNVLSSLFNTSSSVGGGAKTVGGNFGKAFGAVGSLATIGVNTYGAIKSVGDYKENINNIDSNLSLSQEEKEWAKYNAKRERNKSIGNAVGSALGAATFFIPGIGPVLSPFASMLGSWVGGKIGDSLTNKPQGVVPQTTVGNPQYISQNTNNTQNECKIAFDKLNLNVNGSIKLSNDSGMSSSIDINKLMADSQFKSKLVDVISECLRTNTITGRMVSSKNNALS